ncbi:MAG: nodulation protein NfeD [Sulfurimonas sp.]|uniref:NfeD family protein n=1 Tax=Sulfurimonas sp. TaxID=2022749 RepID=UPI0028CF0015|nr:nodulation protein NfeD [Sulfurimonas sp.]MDT8337613.1 nodulation protein NfeD [Sulfurimonas sp.]
MIRLLFLSLLIFLPLFADNALVVKLEIKGAIGPASSEYLKEGMEFAREKDAHMILIELDTPGGLSSSMRDMIQAITNSSLPVVTYVYPKGAHAASAGTYLLYASHIAAMSPGTNLGAATPVSLMPTPNTDANSSALSTLEKKVTNDAVAYIKSLAELNERNVSWALSAVEEAKSISASDALKYGVIDLIAEDIEELLQKLDGREVVLSGKKMTLSTKNTLIQSFEPSWKSRFLSTITNPNIAYILLLLAIYGIFFELMNPGSIFPGVIGVISGVIALYALNMIPFDYAGLLLILLGLAFMVAEVFVVGFGILGIGGVIAFAFGSLLLFDADTLGQSVSIPLIIAFSLSSLAFFVLVMKLFLSSRSAKVVSGADEMIGAAAKVVDVREDGYLVHCHGETWSAVSESKLSIGQNVEVVKLSGLVLKVKPIKE